MLTGVVNFEMLISIKIFFPGIFIRRVNHVRIAIPFYDFVFFKYDLIFIGVKYDIAKIASFLLSEDSSWVTGQILGVDGGMSTLNVN